MEIELLTNGKFTTSGSSVLKMMQNNSMPILDMVVRESIQNCCDAVSINASSVDVNFLCGNFNVTDLAKEFTPLYDRMIDKFESQNSTFLAIRDSNTVGLTGSLDGNFKSSEKNQNLGKLVFHIMKPQEAEEAGGSWGIGKTVYYRIGCGLVIFYSKVKLDTGDYQERLVASLVENENEENGLLADYDENLGVAFFGSLTMDNKVKAIIDGEYIHSFLNIFNISPYKAEETGTTIIIPFTNEERLLNNNMFGDKKWWQTSIEDYLRVSIYRWYFPRMVDEFPKKYGPKLMVKINGNTINDNDETIIFKRFKELYQSCYGDNYPQWITKKPIVRKKDLSNEILGYFSYGKVTKEELHIIDKHFPLPYCYCQVDNNGGETNSPIIAFTRKPGMIVNYCSEGKPIGPILSNSNEFIIGVFSLNSPNFFNAMPTLSLDEYIRQGERSDHTSWTDYEIKELSRKIRVVNSIESGIKSELSTSYGDKKPVTGEGKINKSFAKFFGKLLMPDESFGNLGSSKTVSTKKTGCRTGQGSISTKKGSKIVFLEKQFRKDGIVLKYKMSLSSKVTSIIGSCSVNTINGIIPANKYEYEGLNFPFEIKKILAVVGKYDNKVEKKADVSVVFVDEGQNVKDFSSSMLKTSSGKNYGFRLERGVDCKNIDFYINVLISSLDKTVQMNFDFDIGEQEYE